MRLVPKRAIVLGVLLATGLALGGGGANAAPRAAFVSASGTQLMLNGRPYLFSGINIYNANSDGTCWYPLGSGPGLDGALSEIGSGGKVIRAWFFQTMATTAGHRDWSRFDHTLAVARAHGVKVIVTLANQWPDCEPASGYKDETWYTTGYKQPDPSGTISYRSWATEVATRYRNDPTILAWQLINEAEVKPVINGVCSVNAGAILKAWAADVSGAIKAVDSNHLISVGTIGNGQCGAQGAEYQELHSLPTIDLCEYHDYGSPLVELPGDQWNGLRVRLNQCAALRKPLFIGETGIVPDDVGGYAARATAFAAKFTGEFQAGVVGVLAWGWDSHGSTTFTYDIGPGDPVLGVLALATLPGYTCLGPAVVIAAGVHCDLLGGPYSSVGVKRRGSLRLYNSTVTGTVTANRSTGIDLEASHVGGLHVSSSSGAIRVCETIVSGNAMLDANSAAVTIGALSGCPRNSFGSLTVTGNTGGVSIENNAVSTRLDCRRNSPSPTGGDNTASAKLGQCSAL